MILGVDFSLRATGLAVLCDDGTTDVATVTAPQDDGTVKSVVERLTSIADQIEAWADLGAGDTVVIEGVLHHAPGARRDVMMAGWWWVASRVAALVDDPIIVVTPKTRAKFATGNGNAGKEAVVEQVTARYPQFDVGGDDNIADAVALVAIGARLAGRPIDPDLPPTNLSALQTLTEKGKR